MVRLSKNFGFDEFFSKDGKGTSLLAVEQLQEVRDTVNAPVRIESSTYAPAGLAVHYSYMEKGVTQRKTLLTPAGA